MVTMNYPTEEPVAQGKCCVEGCENLAEESWFPDHCALRDAGVEPQWKHLCLDHDLELNKVVTQMFYGNRYDAELEAYTERQRALRKFIAALCEDGVAVVEL